MMLAQLKRGVRMVGLGLVVLKRNRKLLAFPLVAGISSLAFLAVLLGSSVGVLVGIEGVDAFATQSALETTVTSNPVVIGPALFVGYLGTTFVSVFFTGALVVESRYAFAEEPVSLTRGLARAWAVKSKLFAWALIAAIIGVVIDAVERSNTPISKLFTVVFGALWTVMTFFIVPVAVLDPDSSLRELFARSGRAFRENVGETVIGVGAPRVIAVVIFFLGNGLAVAVSGLTTSALVYAPIVVGAVLAQLFSTTMRGILKTMLYVYATEGKTPAEFDSTDLDAMMS